MRLFWLSLFLLVGATVLKAEEPKFDWWWLGPASGPQGQMLTYVDRASIQRNGKLAAADTYSFVERPFPNGEKASFSRQIYNCKKSTWTLIARTAWDENGKQRETLSWQGGPPTPVAKGSVGEATFRYVCGKGYVTATAVADPRSHAATLLGTALEAADAGPLERQISYGTGFFVSASGELVTSFHVVDGSRSIYVIAGDGRHHKATIYRTSAATDLAVLKVEHRPAKYLTLASPNSAKPGDRVFTFGYPVVDILGSEPKFTDGAISSLSGLGDEAAFSQVSVPIQPGNSGGPLVNEKGKVVGVIAASAAIPAFLKSAGTLPQNVGWAVRGEYLIPLVTPGPPLPSRTREEVVDLARQSVGLVVVER
jgi:S1-C subfamily serine protease